MLQKIGWRDHTQAALRGRELGLISLYETSAKLTHHEIDNVN
jgi:hypothetical protein